MQCQCVHRELTPLHGVLARAQELREGRADLPTVVEGFFTGVFESKGVDRSGFLVRCALSFVSLLATLHH